MGLTQNIKKTVNYSRKNGYAETFFAAWERLTVGYCRDYFYKEPSGKELQRQRSDSSADILFSILVPAYETQERYLSALIESCLAQTYGNWELVIADGSEGSVVEQTVSKYTDSRILYERLPENGGIALNTGKAIELAHGDYCGFLDHDDLLTPDALYEMVQVIKRKGENRPLLVYSDEDKCDSDGKRFYEPHFKLDFNLDLILTNNYICHFMAVETDLLKKLGIRREYDGSQDYDLILRIVSTLLLRERESVDAVRVEERIVHVPKVLYHWRCHENSTADNPASKMYAYEAGKKALTDFVDRMGWKGEVRHHKHLGFYRIEYRNDVLVHRPDLAAVGGYAVRHGRISSGLYKGQRIVYAGYMNRMDMCQDIEMLDIRNLAVNKDYQPVYEQATGHPYEPTLADGTSRELPQWIKALGRDELEAVNGKLSAELRASGARLLLDPEYIRKV